MVLVQKCEWFSRCVLQCQLGPRRLEVDTHMHCFPVRVPISLGVQEQIICCDADWQHTIYGSEDFNTQVGVGDQFHMWQCEEEVEGNIFVQQHHILWSYNWLASGITVTLHGTGGPSREQSDFQTVMWMWCRLIQHSNMRTNQKSPVVTHHLISLGVWLAWVMCGSSARWGGGGGLQVVGSH